MAFLSCRQCPQMDLQRQNQRSRCWWVWDGYGFPSCLHTFKYPLQRRIRINSQIHIKKGGRPHAARRGLFFLPPSGLLVFSSCRGAKLQRIAKRPFHFRCKNHASEGDASGGEEFVAKSRKESQSDHFIFFATKIPLLIRKCQDFFQRSTTQETFEASVETERVASVETQEIRRPNHLQTNIEPWSEGVEPRKRNIVIGFYPQMR